MLSGEIIPMQATAYNHFKFLLNLYSNNTEYDHCNLTPVKPEHGQFVKKKML